MATRIPEGESLSRDSKNSIASEFRRLIGSDNAHPIDSMIRQRRADRFHIAQQRLIPRWNSSENFPTIGEDLFHGSEGEGLTQQIVIGGDIFVSAHNIHAKSSLLIGEYVFSKRSTGPTPTFHEEHFRPIITLTEGIKDGNAGLIMRGLQQLDPVISRFEKQMANIAVKNNTPYEEVYDTLQSAARVFDARFVRALNETPSNIVIFDSVVYGSDDAFSNVLGATVRGSVLGLRNGGTFSYSLPFAHSHITVEDSVIVGQDGIPMTIEGRITRGDPGAARDAVAAVREVMKEKGTTPLAVLAAV